MFDVQKTFKAGIYLQIDLRNKTKSIQKPVKFNHRQHNLNHVKITPKINKIEIWTQTFNLI